MKDEIFYVGPPDEPMFMWECQSCEEYAEIPETAGMPDGWYWLSVGLVGQKERVWYFCSRRCLMEFPMHSYINRATAELEAQIE